MTPLVPNATVTTGGWSSSIGGDLHLALQDHPFSDSAFINWNSAGLDTCVLGLEEGDDPGTDIGLVFAVRAKRTGSAGLEAVLTCDGSPVASMTPSLGTDYETFEHNLTPAEAGAITDYAKLGATLIGSGAFVQVSVSGLALLVPEGGSGGRGWQVLSAVY